MGVLVWLHHAVDRAGVISKFPHLPTWWLMLAIVCEPEYLHGALLCDLAFLTACWLSSKSEHPKRTRLTLHYITFYDLASESTEHGFCYSHRPIQTQGEG